jgi:cytochrome P450
MRLRRETDAVLRAETAARRRAPDLAGREDGLSMLLGARDEEGAGLGDAEMRDELMTLLTAGHETTSTGLCWAFERLTRVPRAMDRLCSELRGNGGEAYLDAVVRETLRLRPVVYDVARMLVEPLEIGGYDVPAGTYIAPGIAAIQTDPSIWRDPSSFLPERFSDERPNMRAWLPFGGGRRFCIGSHLALLEMRSVIREVLARVDLAAVEPAGERIVVRHVTIQPKQGARVRVRPLTLIEPRRDALAAARTDGQPSG